MLVCTSNYLHDLVKDVLYPYKMEFDSIQVKLQSTNESQKGLQQQIECLRLERDSLLDELERASIITKEAR